MKIGRNDPCWCGSGRKYKKCHLFRSRLAPEPPGKLRHKVQQHFRRVTCLHPSASPQTCGQVIKAHTLQKAAVIRRLADASGHVLGFYPPELVAPGRLRLREIGINRASTFSGLCNRHDSLFEPLENHPFEGSPEQCALLGYRAVLHELYTKSGSAGAHALLRDTADRGFDEQGQHTIQETITARQSGISLGLSDLASMRAVYDHAVLAHDWTALAGAALFFDGFLAVAATGAIQPDFDVNGRRLQDLASEAFVQGLAVGVATTTTGAALVFSWPLAYERSQEFVGSVLSLAPDVRSAVCVEWMFRHFENIYFSPSWWRELREDQRQRLNTLAAVLNPYGEYLPYGISTYTSWAWTRTVRWPVL